MEMTSHNHNDVTFSAASHSILCDDIPEVFSGLLDTISITGKSMEMLSGLGRLDVLHAEGLWSLALIYLLYLGS